MLTKKAKGGMKGEWCKRHKEYDDDDDDDNSFSAHSKRQ